LKFLSSDEHYWRFSSGRIERDYPKVIKKVWTGVPTHVDAAFAGIGEAGEFASILTSIVRSAIPKLSE